jgi:hypothetical protein
MKKILILLSVILFGISASFAQVDIVQVNWNWDPATCDCGYALTGDYFKIVLSIKDDANNEWPISDLIAYKEITLPTQYSKQVDVSAIDVYCNKEHENTPSFTVYVTVMLISEDTNPPTECCTGSHVYDNEYSCHDFYNDIVNLTPAFDVD